MTGPTPEARFELAKARFIDGLACLQSGRLADAERHFLASLDAVPGRPSTLINLAATQLGLARPEAALASADAALALEADSIDALLQHATALLQLGRLDDALRSFDRLLELASTAPAAWLGRAQTLGRLGRPDQALAGFERVLALAPTHAEAWSGSGSALRELQRFDAAAHAFREALRHGADRDLNAYYLASVEGRGAPPTAPRDYVEGLFDGYADEFDRHLVGGLGYAAPRHLVEGLVALGHGPFESAVDLGCGTGLCGPLVRPLTRRLVGVDLSPRMLAHARELGVYDVLEHADAVEYLSRADTQHDLVLAADVFIYIGDLAPVFAALQRAMPRGVFCFSVEVLEPGRGEYRLQPTLRYAHSEAYLRRLAAAHGFQPIASNARQVRAEQGAPVPGLFVYSGRFAA
jgi:predicted TPR repeat methyltransferase